MAAGLIGGPATEGLRSGPLGGGPLLVGDGREVDVLQVAAGGLEFRARPLVAQDEGDRATVEVTGRDDVVQLAQGVELVAPDPLAPETAAEARHQRGRAAFGDDAAGDDD